MYTHNNTTTSQDNVTLSFYKITKKKRVNNVADTTDTSGKVLISWSFKRELSILECNSNFECALQLIASKCLRTVSTVICIFIESLRFMLFIVVHNLYNVYTRTCALKFSTLIYNALLKMFCLKTTSYTQKYRFRNHVVSRKILCKQVVLKHSYLFIRLTIYVFSRRY